MTRRRLAALLLSSGLLLITGIVPSAAMAATFTLTTPYPSVTIQPGNTVTFALNLTVPEPEAVGLTISGTPSGWTSSIRGGGNIVSSVYAGTSSSPGVDLSIAIPAGATAGNSTITVNATAGSDVRHLPVTVTVLGTTGGAVTLTSDFPKLTGSASSAFTYSVTLANTGTQKETYTLVGQGPDGWTVSVHPSGNSQALTDTVEGGATDTLSVTAQPPASETAGPYQVQVSATAGTQTASANLEADVTGTPALSLSTPTQVLNASVQAGSTGTVDLVVSNTGSTVLTNVTMSATSPTGWTATFAPPSVATLQPGATATVTATIKPTSDALAGDYDVTFTATSGAANSNVDIRTTVQTSPLWGFVGIALIAVVLIGLAWVFRRFGRR
jgi:uncharacterized membrane protein